MDLWRDGMILEAFGIEKLWWAYIAQKIYFPLKKKQNPVYTCPSSNHEPQQWLAWQIENDSDSNMHMS